MNWKRLIEISRPVGWVAAPLVILLAVMNFGASDLGLVFYAELVLYTFPFCLFLYGINDLYDRDTDSENERKKEGAAFIEGRFLNEDIDGFLKKYSILISIVLLSIPVLRQNLLHLAGTSMLLLFSAIYSAPPARLKARSPLDSISNSFIYFLGPFLIGMSYTSAEIPINFAVWMSTAVFATHAYSTIMDYAPDKKVGLNTFAVRFGQKKTAVLSTGLFLGLTVFTSAFLELRIASLVLALLTAPMIKDDVRKEYSVKVFRLYVYIMVLTLLTVTAGNLQLI